MIAPEWRTMRGRSWKITIGDTCRLPRSTMNYTLYDSLFSRKCQTKLAIITNTTNRVFCVVYTNLPPYEIDPNLIAEGKFIYRCKLDFLNHTSSLFSSARKNLTSLKMSFFSWFEVDSRAMFKFLVSPPSWKLIGSICEATGGKETCYQSPILPLGLRRFLGHNLSTRASSRDFFRFFAFCNFLTRRDATISQRKLSTTLILKVENNSI